MMKDYTSAILLEGEPPAKGFQLRVLQAEREAFTLGFHKAFAFWAGPCSLCPACPTNGRCYNTKDSRPSMEGAGIDVFETVRRAGFALRTLNTKSDFVKYYALILLE
jgi:predicted metal-binding protein